MLPLLSVSFDGNQTLEQLEHKQYGEPPYPSHLVRTTYALRKKPLNDFTVEDLCIMVGQNFNLEYILPLAINVLLANPLAAGEYYPGDLLIVVAST